MRSYRRGRCSGPWWTGLVVGSFFFARLPLSSHAGPTWGSYLRGGGANRHTLGLLPLERQAAEHHGELWWWWWWWGWWAVPKDIHM